MQIYVAYTASSSAQQVLSVEVAQNCVVEDAILQSGILDQFPEIDLKVQPVGIFSHIVPLSRILEPNDRIEIYRPLVCDPKLARRQRVHRNRSGTPSS